MVSSTVLSVVQRAAGTGPAAESTTPLTTSLESPRVRSERFCPDGMGNAIDNGWHDPAITGQSAITPHVVRHTRADVFKGVDICEAAGALGMSAKTLDKVYGHHHVDFQRNAAQV